MEKQSGQRHKHSAEVLVAFHGLFIGVDQYKSADINWLRCAKRDAVALHSLFTDNLGAGAVLLTDQQATRTAIAAEFEKLSTCSADDVVIVAFSGHGSPTHQLITHDADIRDLDKTAIPLGELTEWFSKIPAKRLVCVLDCCFAGGMGAKVLVLDTAPRGLESAEKFLNGMSGDGRLILTAATATEEAFESGRVGHGLLTHFLMQALQGAEEVRESGRISVYRLLEYVTKQVSASASASGKPQHPTLRGAIDGALTWPIFKPGAAYRAAFPDRAAGPVTEDVQSLLTHGFPKEIVSAWAGSVNKLNPLQLDAINEFGLLKGDHVVVSAPTSSGKTMIGELAAVNGVLERRRALFLFPLKALVSDKYQDFRRKYEAFGLKVIRATGDTSDDIPDLMRGRYDICLMTYEKCSALLLAAPYLLGHVGTVVVDEVQMIADRSRGINLEFLLTLLRVRRQAGLEPQVILLSAVIGDTNGLEKWQGARLLRRNERPVPLEEGILRWDGKFRYIGTDGKEAIRDCITPKYGKGSSQDVIIPLTIRLAASGEQVIVFRETKGETVGTARYLARELSLPAATRALSALSDADPSSATTALRECLAAGAAFHNADLTRDERMIIEEEFRAKDATLRVLAATTTLAMGVNTPASSVAIAGLEHPGEGGPTPYSIAEYKNMVGRAGRLGFAEKGTSYLICMDAHEENEMWRRYVLGRPEDLSSRFFSRDTDIRSLILRVLVSSPARMRVEDIAVFLEQSFAAYQESQKAAGWRWNLGTIQAAVAELIAHDLVAEKDGTLELRPLGRLAGHSGTEVETIIRLIEALRSARPETLNDATLIAAAQISVELDAVYFPLNKSSKYKEPETWHDQLTRQGIARSVENALDRFSSGQHTRTLRRKKACSCLMWMSANPIDDIERALMQFSRGDTAAGPIRGVAERTRDLIPTVCEVAQLLHPGLDLEARSRMLVACLQLGIPVAAAELGWAFGGDLQRGDYLRLVKANLGGLDALDKAKDEQLAAVLGDVRKVALVRAGLKSAQETAAKQKPAPRLEDLMPPPTLPPAPN
jgi:replicative superfamily II helicase